LNGGVTTNQNISSKTHEAFSDLSPDPRVAKTKTNKKKAQGEHKMSNKPKKGTKTTAVQEESVKAPPETNTPNSAL